MLDVGRLRVLAAVARHGTVTAAATALHYAQPSVSHHLARLEAETGVRLVQRVGRGIRLTEAGRQLAERAEEILGRLDAAEAELASHAGLRAGRVRLAAFPSALGSFVPAAAARFGAAHPDVTLRFVEAEPADALGRLRAGEVDVALVFGHDDALSGATGVRLVPLLSEPLFLVTRAAAPRPPESLQPPGSTVAESSDGLGSTAAESLDGPPGEALDGVTGSAVAEGAAAMLAEHAGSRWIAGCERCRQDLLRRCADAGFTPAIAFTTDDYVAVQALVAAGLGVTTLPALALRAHRHPGVRVTRLPGAVRQVYAATFGDPPDPPATTRLVEELRAVTSPQFP